MKKQRRDLNTYKVLQYVRKYKDRQTTPVHWKSEAKEDHQLSPDGPSNRQKLQSQPT